MLRIHDLVFDAWGRRFFDHATVSLPVGDQGRAGRAQRRRQVDPVQADPGPAQRGRRMRSTGRAPARIATVEQEHAATPSPPAGDGARRRPRAGQADGTSWRPRSRSAWVTSTPGSREIDADRAPARAAEILSRPRLHHRRPGAADGGVLRRMADARRHGRGPVRRAGPAAARRADQLSRPRGRAVAGGAAAEISAQRPDHQPRPRAARPIRSTPSST